MSKPLTLRLLAKLLYVEPEILQGDDSAAEFIAAICRRLDIKLSKRCEICGYDLDINTWKQHSIGMIKCSGLRDDLLQAKHTLEQIKKKYESDEDSWVADLQNATDEKQKLLTYLRACEDDLTAAGVTMEVKNVFMANSGNIEPAPGLTEPLDLRQRIGLLLKHPAGDRDFSWAMEQVNAGKTVTHPCLTNPSDERGHIRKIGIFVKDSVEHTVYELNQGGMVYNQLLTDSYTWIQFAHRAQKTHGWEIIGDD